MLKKVFFVFVAAVFAASCIESGPTSTQSYHLRVSFEYGAVAGSDSLQVESQEGYGFGWQNMAFYHKLSGDKSEFKGGFILSTLKGGGTSDKDRFRVNSGAGANGSYNYVVYYSNPDKNLMPEYDISFLSSQYGDCVMAGCYVNNTKEVAAFVRENFVAGDRLSLRMTGYLDGEKTGEQSFLLAEKTGQKDSLVTSWTPFELDKLGSIDYIDIEVESNRDDIPKAFCMDDMLARISIAY